MLYYSMKGAVAIKRKAIVSIRECVACGCCVKVCPRKAISVPFGIYAEINQNLCVGCGKCVQECPASVICIEEVSHEAEKEMV